MRTVHTYAPAQQQQQQQSSTSVSSSSSTSSSSATTNQTNVHQHSSMSGYPSVRHSLFRMHSQLRSAPNRRETAQGPIDLSLYRIPQPTAPKMTTRSTSTTHTTLRSAPIVTSLVTTPTHTIYSNAVPSSTSSQTATSMSSHEHKSKLQKSFSADVESKCSTSSTRACSPKLAYSFSNIEENLQCPLCIDRLRDPRALPCQHVFCCSCLKSIPSSNIPYPTIACPLCRRTFPYNGADQFPISYIHRQLLELVPENYDINGKCAKCQEKSSLILCSCCDFLLCQACFRNDREKIIDNIKHIVQACRYRVTRIQTTHNQIADLKESNRRKIQQAESIYENFERKYFEHKQSTLNSLNGYNEGISESFWSKLNLSARNPTEGITELLKQADSLLEKSQVIQFDDILSLFYNLNSINEQLEQANALIDTCDVQNLLKQNIQVNPANDLDEQICVRLNQTDNTEKLVPLIPSTMLPRSIKRLRKTEPKRHVEEIDDDDDEEEEEEEEGGLDNEHLPILKRMKVEYQNEFSLDQLPSPTNSILYLNFSGTEQQQTADDEEHEDADIIYVKTVQPKSPATLHFEELFQIIETNQ